MGDGLAQKPDRPVLGALLVMAGVFLVACQDVIVKLFSNDLVVWQIFALRGVAVVPLLLVLGYVWQRRSGHWRMAVQFWPLCRSALFMVMFISYYFVLAFMDLATIASALYTFPLFIALLSAFIIREPVKPLGWLAIGIGFAGVLVILRPGTSAFTPYALVPVISGLCYALAAIITRAKCQHVTPLAFVISLNLVMSVGSLIISLGVYLIDPDPAQIALHPFFLSPWRMLDHTGMIAVVSLAVLMIGSAVMVAAAYKIAPPVIVATYDYSYLVFVTLFGIFIFAEHPDLWVFIGMALIALGGLMVLRR